MKREYDGRELWFAARPALRDDPDPVTDILKSYGYHMIREGNVKFDLIRYIDSPVGEARMKQLKLTLTYPTGEEPEVIAHWRDRGIEKKVHRDDGPRGTWASYVPLHRRSERKLPLVIQTNLDFFDMESHGFVDLAADGSDDLAVFAANSLEPENIAALIDIAIADYDVDPERVYLSGCSYGGIMSSWLALCHAGRVAGVNSLNICYYYNLPEDSLVQYGDAFCSARDESTPRLIDAAEQLRLPVIITGGMTENFMNPVFPMSTRYHETDGAVLHNLRGVDMWCRINHLRRYDFAVDVAKAYASDDPVERVIGLPVDSGKIVEQLGVNSYFADLKDEDGVPYLRFIATENNCHEVFPCNAADVWAFFKQFRRDIRTGRIIYEPAE